MHILAPKFVNSVHLGRLYSVAHIHAWAALGMSTLVHTIDYTNRCSNRDDHRDTDVHCAAEQVELCSA